MRGLPGLEADAGHGLALARAAQGRGPAIDQELVAAGRQPCDLALQALDRRIHEAGGAAGGAFLGHHVPGFQRGADFQPDAFILHGADLREAELPVRAEPFGIKGKAVAVHVGDHVFQVGPDEMRQHETVMQRGAPAHQRRLIGLAPEARDQGAQQQRLRQAHFRVRRHLEAAEFHQAQAAGGTIGRIELVYADFGAVGIAGGIRQQVAEHPVHQPGRNIGRGARRDFVERNLHLVQRVMARFVGAWRLAGRADEEPAEQIGQRRMVLPIGDDAFQHVGAAQERTVGRGLRPHHDMITAAGAGVAAIQQEFLGRKPAGGRFLIQGLGDVHLLAPVLRGMDVHFDDAGIGRDLDDIDARIKRRRIAFDMHRHAKRFGRLFHCRQQLEVIARCRRGRHEHAQPAIARLNGECGAHGRLGGQVADLGIDGAIGFGPHFIGQIAVGAPASGKGLAAVFRFFQRRQRRKGIGRRHKAALAWRHIGQGIQRQAESDGAVTRQQEQVAAAGGPMLAQPAIDAHLHRQHIADGG